LNFSWFWLVLPILVSKKLTRTEKNEIHSQTEQSKLGLTSIVATKATKSLRTVQCVNNIKH